MNIQQSYDLWSEIYDTNFNKTRDLEAIAISRSLPTQHFKKCLEVGCGTGKNTKFLLERANQVTCIDISEAMLLKAKEKFKSDRVTFQQADITMKWDFGTDGFDLITFSLILEHIDDLGSVFKKAAASLVPGGYVYIGELHPFKQYSGTRARFSTKSGQQIVPCFTHHVSDFVQAAIENGFRILDLNEFFDDNDLTVTPRILTILLTKPL